MMAVGLGIGLPFGGGGQGPGAFVPGLTMWHDASRTDKVALNGGDVSQIDDLTSQARHASQGTAGQQPLYATGGSGINGLSVAAFTGANNDVLDIANALGLARNKPGITYAGVFRIPTLGANHRLLTILAGTGVTLFAALIGGTGAIAMTSRRVGADGAGANASATSVSAGVPFFAAWSIDYAAAATIMTRDGTSFAQAATWAAGPASEDVAHASVPTIGRNSANTITGDFGEACFWPFALSAAQIDTLRTSYFKPKWGTP